MKHVNPEQLLVQLKTRGLVTPEEEYMLLNSNFSPQKRTKNYLLQLCSKDPNNCVQLFYQCLRAETEHSGHQYLANLLEPEMHRYECQSQLQNKRGLDAVMSEAEIDDILPTLKSCWVQVANILSTPQEMVNNIISSSQDPEEQAKMFIHYYTIYSQKENIYHALDQLTS